MCQEHGEPVSLSPALSREPGVATAAAAGVKSWLEAGERGRIRLGAAGNTMGCQSRSCLFCLVTMSGGAGSSRLEKPCFVCSSGS